MSKYRFTTPMTIIIFLTIISFISSCFSNNNNGGTSTVDFKVENLINQMTLEEKAGQMTQIGIPVILEQEGYWDAADTLIIDTNPRRSHLITRLRDRSLNLSHCQRHCHCLSELLLLGHAICILHAFAKCPLQRILVHPPFGGTPRYPGWSSCLFGHGHFPCSRGYVVTLNPDGGPWSGVALVISAFGLPKQG